MNLILTFIFLLLISGTFSTLSDNITYLHKRLYKKYWKQNQDFIPFALWDQKKGLFQSQIHFNVVDKNNKGKAALFRQRFKIDDENMFVTSFVLYGLLQAHQLKTISLDHHTFSQSLEAISDFRDKNSPYGLPQYMFWPQQKINGTWSSKSVNLFNLIDLLPNFPPRMETFLQKHGMGIWIYAKQIKKAFCIPADNDDSSVNIALLGYLNEINSQHYEFWKNINFGIKSFYKNILKYAYRPFSKHKLYPRADEIDPRTYFALHPFLKMRKQRALQRGQEPNLILPTTWIMNFDEQIIDIVAMPFYLNNVDASVNANFLFGLLYQIKSGQIIPDDELRQMMADITDLLVFVIEFTIQTRPDLILMYYPSKYDFYWFVARNVALLQRMDREDPLIQEIYQRLSKVMRTVATLKIIKERKKSSESMSYWAQFLGNFAGKQRNQDAIFSTSLALNALLDTWGIKSNDKYQYLQETPSEVKQIISEGITYLQSSLKGKRPKEGNAFFSGSLKILYQDFPEFFPANMILDNTSKPINAQNSTFDQMSNVVIDCVKGYIEDEDYQKMLKMKWFQYDVPIEFTGYNTGKGMLFPYWSSSAITEIMMITAFSKYLRATSTN